ncbi:hypothetical protein D3C71_1010010 [compost metagenome]
MPVWMLAIMMSAAASEASPRQVHTCVVEGRRQYQSTPCTGQTERIRDMPPPVDTRANALYIESLRQQLKAKRRAETAPARARGSPRRNVRPAPALRGAVISVHADPVRCDAARRQRETTYTKAGDRPSLALSRRMDDLVHDACR